MQKHHADKVCTFHGHGFLPTAVGIVFVLKGDRVIVYGDDPAVCDGCAVGITGKIPDGIALPVKGLLDERKPQLFKQGIDKGLPFIRILKAALTGKVEQTLVVKPFQSSDIPSPESGGNCLDGEKEAFVGCLNKFSGRSDSTLYVLQYALYGRD